MGTVRHLWSGQNADSGDEAGFIAGSGEVKMSRLKTPAHYPRLLFPDRND